MLAIIFLPVKNPILNAGVGIGSLFLRLVPRGLDLAEKRIFVGLRALLHLFALVREILLKASSVPVGIRARDGGLPVCLDEVLQFLAVSSLGESDIVVRQPSLELSLVPFVVGWSMN